MEDRALGRTGLMVSALGFGCGAIGGLLVKGDPAEQRRTVGRALEAGVTYFDTAPAYGQGRSEEVIGPMLQELKADVVLGTKFRIEPDQVADAPAEIRRQLEASLRRLRMDRVHILHLHNRIGIDVSGNQGALSVADVLGPIADGLDELRAAGLIGFSGITGLGESAAVKEVVASGRFQSVQTYVNALNPTAGWPGGRSDVQDFDGLLTTAREAGVGTVGIRILAAGALALTPVPARHENAGHPGEPLIRGGEYDADLRRADALRALAAEAGLEGPAELSYRLVLGHPGLSTALVGASDLAQLEDAIRWVERGPLDAALVERVVALGTA